MVWVSDKAEGNFRQTAAELQLSIRALDTARGFNYSNGKKVTTRLYALVRDIKIL